MPRVQFDWDAHSDNEEFMKSKHKNKVKDVIVEITEADYQEQLAEGLAEEFLLKPGRHVMRRGGFLERHPDFLTGGPPETFVNVTLRLKLEVFKYYEQRAAELQADSYQTVMAEILQQAMPGTAALQAQVLLLNDERFISAVAERVKKLPTARKNKRPTKTTVKAKAA